MMVGTQEALWDNEDQSHTLWIKKQKVEAIWVPDDYGTVKIALMTPD